MTKLESLAVAVSKHFAELYASEEPKHKVSVLSLRKVCDRAQSAYDAAEFPGADARPWLEARVRKFLAAARGQGETVDKDLLPQGHPDRARGQADPWAELMSAEERIGALQKSLIESVTRADVRKAQDADLVGMNRRLSHLYEVHFGGNQREQGVTGIARQKVVSAAAHVHEELERRGLFAGEEPFPREVCRELYTEALKARAATTVTVHTGKLVQHADGVELQLADGARLFVAGRPSPIGKSGVALTTEDLAARFSPAGSLTHTPFLEPHEAPYVCEPDTPLGSGALIGEITYTKGARTDVFTELFVLGALSGVLVIGKRSVMLRKSLVPYVLTPQAVAQQYMPPDGESALPDTLEWDVPPEQRYWKAACGQDAREIRDQLAGLFTDQNVRFVDGVPRRTLIKHYVAPPHAPQPAVFAEVLPEARPEAALFKAHMETPTAFADAHAAARAVVERGGFGLLSHGARYGYYFEPADLTAAVTALKSDALALVGPAVHFLIGLPDEGEARDALEKYGRPFTLPGVVGKVFVASHPVVPDVDWIEGAALPVTNEESLEKKAVHLVKSTASDDEQYVLGIVLEPDVVDAQSDTYSEFEVRKSAHRFMAFYQNAGLMHKTLVNDSVRIVESYLCPADCEIGGAPVKKGTWLMAMLIEDEALWSAVKSGELTGFSIGGSAIRSEEV